MRDDAPAARSIDVNAEDAELSAELAALHGASLCAHAGDRSDIAVNLHLDIGAVNEAVCIGRSLNELDLLGLVDDLAKVGDAGKIIRENGVKDSGIVELDGVGEALFEIDDCLAVSFLIWF